MRISCEIRVNYPPEGEFLPGDQVTGSIKYSVDEETVFNKIIVSLKGFGRVVIKNHRMVHNPQYGDTEPYVDVDHTDYNETKLAAVPQELYEKDFNFQLPRDFPSSFEYEDSGRGVTVNATMIFYIRIKFERHGLLELKKSFKKEIFVRAALNPTLSNEPLLISKQFKMIKFGVDQSIDVKAVIENPVIRMNGTIRFSYEISNNTKMVLEGVKVKIAEMYRFKSKILPNEVRYRDVEGTSSKSGSIVCGGTQVMDFELNLPPNACTVQNWKEMSRDYFVKLKILLPLFSINRVVEIPIQIGDVIEDRAGGFVAPPSYWKSMGEYEKEWSVDADDAGG